MGKFEDLTGQKFGNLNVIKPTTKRNISHRVIWLCECECGNQTEVSADHLKSGNTKSCGCIGKDSSIKNLQNTLYDGTRPCTLKSIYEGKRPIHNKTGYIGITQQKNDKYVASIRFRKKLIYLGTYENIEDAIDARKKAEIKYFKPYLENVHK